MKRILLAISIPAIGAAAVASAEVNVAALTERSLHVTG